MKNRNCSLITFSLLLLLVLMGFSACSKDSPTTPTPPAAPSGFITGTVYAQGRAVLPDVKVKVGTDSTTTDIYGMYMLNDVPVGANVRVDFAKDGFISLQKTVAVENGKTSNLSCTMFTPNVVEINGLIGATVSEGGADIVIPPNAFVDANNVPFTGTVKTEMKYFDPTNAECLEAFPGNFTGLLDGVSTGFESYGFIAASFFDAAKVNSKLTLDPLKPATLKVPIPTSLQNNPPLSMPLWYYDEAAGTWIADGTANKVGNFYEGTVTHFTYWNFDNPITVTDEAELTGFVKWNGAGGDPVAGAQVVATGVDYAGYTKVYSGTDGSFTITVKANSQVKVRAYIGQNSSTASSPTITTPAGGLSDPTPIADIYVYDVSYRLNGKLVTTDNQPLANQTVDVNQVGGNSISGSTQTDANGNFSIQVYPSESKGLITVMFSSGGWGEPSLYSPQLQFNEPQVGQIYNFPNPIVMGPGGSITGTVKDNNGNLITNSQMWFMSESGGMQGELMANIDENGVFLLTGAPNTTLSGLRGSTYSNGTSYQSNSLITFNFPAAGQTSNYGVIVCSPYVAPSKK